MYCINLSRRVHRIVTLVVGGASCALVDIDGYVLVSSIGAVPITSPPQLQL
jgi:hypothetical protein